jgi:anti-anti-sigma regulatory factor
MPVASVPAAEHASRQRLDIRTIAVDASQATVRVSGELSSGCAALIAVVLDGHLRAGRRFVRLNLGGAHTIDRAVVAQLRSAHRAFLERRGTLILTGVGPEVAAALSVAGAAADFLVLPPAADEQWVPALV